MANIAIFLHRCVTKTQQCLLTLASCSFTVSPSLAWVVQLFAALTDPWNGLFHLCGFKIKINKQIKLTLTVTSFKHWPLNINILLVLLFVPGCLSVLRIFIFLFFPASTFCFWGNIFAFQGILCTGAKRKKKGKKSLKQFVSFCSRKSIGTPPWL